MGVQHAVHLVDVDGLVGFPFSKLPSKPFGKVGNRPNAVENDDSGCVRYFVMNAAEFIFGEPSLTQRSPAREETPQSR